MPIALKKNKRNRAEDQLSKADRIAIKLGGTRFDPEKAVVDLDFELEDFLKWRNERRKAEVEAQRDCQP